MPYTTPEQIQSHLASEKIPSRPVADQPVLIDTNDAIPFSAVSILSGTLRAKVRRARKHERTTLALENSLVFSSQPVVPGSVVVGSDSSMGQMFVEPVDYLVDHPAGKITPRSGGLMLVGSPVTIWYLPYTVLTESTDYHVDYESAAVRRTTSGEITLGETISLDYTPQHAGVIEEMILSAVAAANGLIERRVDPNGQFEADPVLGLAATYTALEIVCRSAAARDLSFRTGQDRTARTWMQLASDYAVRAEQLMTAFRPPVTPLASPTLS